MFKRVYPTVRTNAVLQNVNGPTAPLAEVFYKVGNDIKPLQILDIETINQTLLAIGNRSLRTALQRLNETNKVQISFLRRLFEGIQWAHRAFGLRSAGRGGCIAECTQFCGVPNVPTVESGNAV